MFTIFVITLQKASKENVSLGIHIIIIYRLHLSTKSKVKSSDFFAEFAIFINELSSIFDEVIIAGDYNIH